MTVRLCPCGKPANGEYCPAVVTGRAIGSERAPALSFPVREGYVCRECGFE